MQFLQWLYVAAVVLLLFGASIFVHEFGHFWMARRRGLKVEGFSIGFGPKLFGWRRNGIDYAWRWLPAGGFVALPQMVTSTTLEGKSRVAGPLPPASPGSKILVALFGPAMNALFAFAIATAIYFLGLPVLVDPAIVGGVERDSPEAKLGIRPGDRIVSVNGQPVASWDDAQKTAMLARTNVLPVTIERDGLPTTFLLTTKVSEQLGVKLLNLEPQDYPAIEKVMDGSAAELAGLKPGDEVLSVAGLPVLGQQHLIDLIKARPAQPTSILIRRGPQALPLTVVPQPEPVTGTGRLGALIGSSRTSVFQLQKPGPPPWELVGAICRQTVETINALAHSKQTGVGLGDLSGPPGILFILAIELKTDFRLALRFMVLLNLSLAILNLMPIPVLDGGHILLAIIEKLRGRPLHPRVQEYATAAFAALLISLILYISCNDLLRRGSLFRSMLNQQVQIQPGDAPAKSPASTK